jgi:hypothetical protein
MKSMLTPVAGRGKIVGLARNRSYFGLRRADLPLKRYVPNIVSYSKHARVLVCLVRVESGDAPNKWNMNKILTKWNIVSLKQAIEVE